MTVKKMLDLGEYDGIVYDIETSEGCFNGGVGEIVLKNTDSVFISYDTRFPDGTKMEGMDALKESIRLGVETEKHIQKLFKSPQRLEYEKTFYPFIIFSKKRYVGNKYEFDLKKYKQTSMGIVLKRRDNAQIVKKIYGGIIDKILNEHNIESAKEYYVKEIDNLLDGNVDIKDLIISKTLNANYANPTQIAHKILADRMGERDAGNRPQSNDRIPFVYIDERNLKCRDCCGEISDYLNCKCRDCMKLFCIDHLDEHCCQKKCRFCGKTCKKTDDFGIVECDYSKSRDCGGIDLSKKAWNYKNECCSIKRCSKCLGIFCYNCMVKHTIVLDKYKKPNQKKNKCVKEISRKIIQGDVIEAPSYVIEKELKTDYRYYYDHQIKNPVNQIFELEMEEPYSLVRDLIEKDNETKGIISKEKRAKIREEKKKLREKEKEEKRIRRVKEKEERIKRKEEEKEEKRKRKEKEKQEKKAAKFVKNCQKNKMNIIKIKPKPPKDKSKELEIGIILPSSNIEGINYIVIETKTGTKRWKKM